MYYQYWKVSDDEVLLFQLQRIKCVDGQVAHPAIEGFHQDGNDNDGLLCIDRHNITGGYSQLKLSKDAKEFALDAVLEPKQLLLFDDRYYWHYATPIVPVDKKKDACRDVVLMSTPSQQHMGPLIKK